MPDRKRTSLSVDNTVLSLPTKKKRLPRFRRVATPPAMVMTARDRQILLSVYAYRVMTREQVERLHFAPSNGQDHPTKTTKVRLRLKLLFQHGYLERIPTPVGPGTWAWRPVYRLSKKGAQLVAVELGLPLTELHYWGRGDDNEHRASRPQLLFLDHALKINDVRIAITLAASKRGYQVEKWVDDSQLKSQEMKDYVSVTAEQGRSLKVAVIPDAYFVLDLGDRLAHFFLELDLATMSNQRWRTRIRAYLAYVRSGKYQKRYQTRSLRVLTVTTTPKRLVNLKATTTHAGGGEMFWFATWDQIMAQDILHSLIWLVGEDPKMRPLIF